MARYFDESLFPDKESPKEMTPENLRRYPGCEHYSDEQAKEIIETLEKLANILYDIHIQQSQLPNDKMADL